MGHDVFYVSIGDPMFTGRPVDLHWLLLYYKIRPLGETTLRQEYRLAFKAGLHPSYVAQVERGERNISLRNICALADALDVDAGELLRRPA